MATDDDDRPQEPISIKKITVFVNPFEVQPPPPPPPRFRLDEASSYGPQLSFAVFAVQEARKTTAAADAKRQTEEKEKAARLADPDAHRIGGWMMKPTAAPGAGAGAGGGKKGGVGKYLSSAAFKH